MNPQTILSILGVLLVVALFVSYIGSRPRGAQFTPLANVGEGFQPASQTFLTDGALAERYLLVKGGSDAGHVALCGVGDIPKGIAHDSAAAAEESVTVHKLGLFEEGALGVASGAIAVDELLVPGANGTVRKLPAVAGVYRVIGRATKAAADTERVEYTPCFPVLVVVPTVITAPAVATSTNGVAAAAAADLAALAAETEKIGDDAREALAKVSAIHAALVANGQIVIA